ncbi:MAG: hypothetical protein KJ709_04880 [Nanoarchaeota archaeon]|nr:hypothetical protein [Nanoarchaeota archaeon]
MVDDEYELTPHKQLEELRHEIEILRKNPLHDTKESKDLLAAVDRLNASINTLIDMFKLAADDMKKGHEDSPVNMDPLLDRMGELERQNKIIAEGMVSLSDLVKKAHATNEPPRPNVFNPPPFKPMYNPPPPLMHSPEPRPMAPPPTPLDAPMPPPEDRRGLFNFRK